jgi:hypothetical protein
MTMPSGKPQQRQPSQPRGGGFFTDLAAVCDKPETRVMVRDAFVDRLLQRVWRAHVADMRKKKRGPGRPRKEPQV